MGFLLWLPDSGGIMISLQLISSRNRNKRVFIELLLVVLIDAGACLSVGKENSLIGKEKVGVV